MKKLIANWLIANGFKFDYTEHYFFQRIGRVSLILVVHTFGNEQSGTVGVYRGLRACDEVVCRKDLVVNGSVWTDFDGSNKTVVLEQICLHLEQETASMLLYWLELLRQGAEEASSIACRREFEAEIQVRTLQKGEDRV